MPRVSVITPLFNKAVYISETIRSVLAQTMRDWELIVVENGSTDDGPNLVRRFSDSRIRLVDSVRRGPGAARNVGVHAARSEWLLFLDADDLIEKTYLERRLIAGSVDAFAKVVAGPWQEFHDTEPSRRALRYPAAWKQDTKRLEAAAFAYAPWALHAAIVRREYVSPSRLWNESLDALPSEDCAFWYPIIHAAPVIWSEDNGALYRKHGCDSRDEIVKDLELGFRACSGTIAANEEFLAKMGKRPSPEQAATVVRVLRRIWMRAIRENLAIVGVGSEIRRWLKKTSYRDLRMVACRLLFAELRRAPKAQAATR
jgi:glycosyltransferase involved in cell wall biosynthesis